MGQNIILQTVDALFRLSGAATQEIVVEAQKIEHSMPFRFASERGSAIWPNKRGKGVSYARKRRFRGGRFKW